MFYALADDDKERITNKIELFIALAPITKIGTVAQKDIFTQLSKYIPTLKNGTAQLGIHEYQV